MVNPLLAAWGKQGRDYIGMLYEYDQPEQYRGATNPFPWMSEVLDLKKEKNFFETRVTEYQTGGALNWD